jgi:hypothetical protein
MLLRLHRSARLSIYSGAMACFAFAAGCSAPARMFADANPTDRNEPSIAQLVEQHRALEQPALVREHYSKASYGPPTMEEARAAEPEAASPATPTIAQTEQLGEVLADLQRQGAIDAATQSQLLDSLKQTDPALWPQLLAYFKAAATRKSTVPASQPESAVQLASAQQVVPEADSPPKKKEGERASEPEEKSEPAPATAIATDESDEPDESDEQEQETEPDEKPVARKKTKQRRKKPAREEPLEVDDPTWRQQLQASIAKLETETQNAPTSHDEIGKHAALRMLYLAAGRREDALKPIAGIPPAHQDFWSKEVYGLAALMDHQRNPDTNRRAAEARCHLRDAAARLGELATLQVCNLTCCREVTSYGVYKPFESSEFQPGQEILLYAEIENFKSEHTDLGYHTALKASYQILDERGARVDEKEFALTEEHCQNPRHDFFVRYFVWLPQKIYGGTYTLQLSVEDTLSQKLGQASVNFTIKPQ